MKKLLILLTTVLIFSCNNNGEKDDPRDGYFTITPTVVNQVSHTVSLESSHSDDPKEVSVKCYYDSDTTSYPVTGLNWKEEDGGNPPDSTTWNPWINHLGASSITYTGFVKGDNHGIVTIPATPVTVPRNQ